MIRAASYLLSSFMVEDGIYEVKPQIQKPVVYFFHATSRNVARERAAKGMCVRQQCDLLGSPCHTRTHRSKCGIWRTNAVLRSSTDQTRVLQLVSSRQSSKWVVGVWRRTSQEAAESWRLEDDWAAQAHRSLRQLPTGASTVEIGATDSPCKC